MSRDKESFYRRPEVHIRHSAVFGLIHDGYFCLILFADDIWLFCRTLSVGWWACVVCISFNFLPLVQCCFNQEKSIEHLVDRVVKEGSRNATRNTEAKWTQSVVCSLSNVVYCAQTQPLPNWRARQEVRLFFHGTGLMAWSIWPGSRSSERENMPRWSWQCSGSEEKQDGWCHSYSDFVSLR